MYIFVLALCLASCSNDQNESLTSVDATVQTDHTTDGVETFPGKLPTENPISTLVLSGEATWENIHRAYRNELPTYEGADYYPNLQWAAIELLIANEAFLQEADTEIKSYYLSEIQKRNVVNQPEVALRLLNNLAEEVAPNIIASAATKVLDINQSYWTGDRLAQYKTEHSEAINGLNSLAVGI